MATTTSSKPNAKKPAATKAAASSAADAFPPPADEPEAKPHKPAKLPEVGQLVSYTFFNSLLGAGGDDETKWGVVTSIETTHPDGTDRLDDDGNPSPGARIGWLPESSDPVAVSDLVW